jgi:hypothetical protein
VITGHLFQKRPARAPGINASDHRTGTRLGGLVLLILLMLGTDHVGAQRVTDPNANLWISHWGDQRFTDRWSFHTEAHVRRAELGASWQQLLLRPAVNYHLNGQVMFTVGYSYYHNYRYGAYPIRFENWEHHLFQQVQLGSSYGRLAIAHRFRLEERFIAQLTPSPENPAEGVFDTYQYQNRFRYRVWLTLPLGHDKVGPGVFTANLYDEVFLNFGDSQRLDYMHQNRLSGLLGYQVSEPFSLLAGYLWQVIQRPGAANGADLQELNSTLHIALVYNADLRKERSSGSSSR